LFALVIGLLGCNRASNGVNTNVGDPKLTETRARDAADIKTLEERFTTAFRAKDVNAIMQLCVPDDSLQIFDVQPPREVKGRAAYRKDW
jgi:ketosteroid isomerase-like protein